MPTRHHVAAAVLLAATVLAGGQMGCASKKKTPIDPQVEAKRQETMAQAKEQQAEAMELHQRARILADSAAAFRAEAVELREAAAANERSAKQLLAEAHELDLDAASAYAAGLAYDDLLDRDRAAKSTATGMTRTAKAAACRDRAAQLRQERDAKFAHADQLDADALVAMGEARDLLDESNQTHAKARMTFASVQ